MITRLFSAALRGVDAQEVEVEVNARGADKPLIIIVGLPDTSVKESSQRVTSAISASALSYADGVNTVNLAPADVKKEGPSFDLPIALAMAAANVLQPFNAEDCCVVGELGLDGTVRPVKGVLSIALEAKRRGRKRLLVPDANAAEAAIVDGIDVIPIRNLRQAWDFLQGTTSSRRSSSTAVRSSTPTATTGALGGGHAGEPSKSRKPGEGHRAPSQPLPVLQSAPC